ncbi:MAG: hypothetical protein ACRES6_01980 [Steroidobacteraceae bacterium]
MKAKEAGPALAGRFDRLSLRERVLTTAATLAVLIALVNMLVFQRLEARRKQLAQQLTAIAAAFDGGAPTADGADSPDATLQRTNALAASLSQATARLDSQSAGLIPPQQMLQVIHDVLSRQQGVTLVSLRSLPPYALIDGPPSENADASTPAAANVDAAEGPYVHSVQLVLQGRYLDVLAYLRALEGLPWHFYWQSLSLDATQYPMTRATVKLGTVSMSREWIAL